MARKAFAISAIFLCLFVISLNRFTSYAQETIGPSSPPPLSDQPIEPTSQLQDYESWSHYIDEGSAIQIAYPVDWVVDKNPLSMDYFIVHSPDYKANPIDRPIQGASINLVVLPLYEDNIDNYSEQLRLLNPFNSKRPISVSNYEGYRIDGSNEDYNEFITILLDVEGNIYKLEAVKAISAPGTYREILEKIITSVEILPSQLTMALQRKQEITGQPLANDVLEYQTNLSYPDFILPWDSGKYNGNVLWTGGPHSWSKGGQEHLTDKISASVGNGLDFAYPGKTFEVISMASGIVTANTCGKAGLGCIVAIKHDIGGSVMIYAHLLPNSSHTAPSNSLQLYKWYSQGTPLGMASNSGQNVGSPIHLHIEFRDGATCYAECGDIGFAGSPIGWDGRKFIDKHYISGYFDSENGCAPGADCDTIFNYDGSAVKGATAIPYLNFPYKDNGIPRKVLAFVHPLFGCPSSTNCEINYPNLTVFADQGKFSGGGGILYSTNHAVPLPSGNDVTPPSGYFTSPSNGSTHHRSVIISVNAGDDSSGVKEVRFSAKWGGSWHGIGFDSSSPYSINWDMCNSGVPDGDVEIGMEIWDNANNKFLWSEHGSNPHISKSYTCSGGDLIHGNSWNVKAWQNRYMAGWVNYEGKYTQPNGDPYIWWDFGSGGPFGWGGDQFSMQLWKNVYFPGGYYEFHTEHDDGLMLYLDGNNILKANWPGNGIHDVGLNINQGDHEVKVEYFEDTGDAFLHVVWYGAGYPKPDNNPPFVRITRPSHLSATNQTILNIDAETSDDASGVNRVVYSVWYADENQPNGAWHEIGTSNSAPYSLSWDWSFVGDRHIWLDARVYDNTGKNSINSEGWVEVELDRKPPQVSFERPQENTIHPAGDIELVVSANGTGCAIREIKFFAGYNDNSSEYWHQIGIDSDGSNGWGMTWAPPSLPLGTHVSFFVYAYDQANNLASALVKDNYLQLDTTFRKLTPVNGASDQETSLMFDWADSNGANSYEFCLDTSNNNNCDTNWQTVTGNTGIYQQGLNTETSYYWQVRAVTSSGKVDADGGTWWSFTTNSIIQDGYEPDNIPSQAKLISNGESQTHSIVPANDYDWVKFELTETSSFQITTSGSGGDNEMRVFDPQLVPILHDRANGGSDLAKIEWSCGGWVLPPGTYYALVGEYGQDQEIESYDISISIVPCPTFQKESPSNGLTGLLYKTILNWSVLPGAINYEVCITTMASSINSTDCPVPWKNVGTNTWKGITLYSYNKSYYWQVRANVNGTYIYADLGTWWVFITGRGRGGGGSGGGGKRIIRD